MFKSKAYGDVTKESLQTFTGPQLAGIYNELQYANGYMKPKLIKKFSDLKTGQKRVAEELATFEKDGDQSREEATPEQKPKKQKKSKEPKAPKQAAALNLEEAEEILNHRPNTNRGQIIALITRSEGASMEELTEATGWAASKIRHQLRAINVDIGHGIKETKTDHFKGTGRPKDRKLMSFPAMKAIKPHREGTKRAKLINLLSGKGATVDKVMEEIGWKRIDAIEGIRCLHSYCGYGIHEDDKGVITLLTE